MNLDTTRPGTARSTRWHRIFAGSAGLSAGFAPAFQHRRSGEIRLAAEPDGRLATAHSLDGLPAHWVEARDEQGRPAVLIADVRAGYARGGEFWTLADLLHPLLDA